eukprot:365958-Chlamydomonas_euryale.AAC.10
MCHVCSGRSSCRGLLIAMRPAVAFGDSVTPPAAAAAARAASDAPAPPLEPFGCAADGSGDCVSSEPRADVNVMVECAAVRCCGGGAGCVPRCGDAGRPARAASAVRPNSSCLVGVPAGVLRCEG